MIRMTSTLTIVPTSMICTSDSPSFWTSDAVATPPLKLAERVVPLTVFSMMALIFASAACVSGAASAPGKVIGRFQAFLSLLSSICRNSGVPMKSCTDILSWVSCRRLSSSLR